MSKQAIIGLSVLAVAIIIISWLIITERLTIKYGKCGCQKSNVKDVNDVKIPVIDNSQRSNKPVLEFGSTIWVERVGEFKITNTRKAISMSFPTVIFKLEPSGGLIGPSKELKAKYTYQLGEIINFKLSGNTYKYQISKDNTGEYELILMK